MNILQAFDDPRLFAPAVPKGSWAAWRAFLAALFALELSQDHADLFRACTGRSTAPVAPFAEAWLVCGRRAGKSFILAVIAVYLACFRSYAEYLAPGERATIMIIAADRRQARVIFRFVRGLLNAVPILAKLIEGELAEAIHLSNRVTIEVVTASHRVTRGYTIAAALLDEVAFWGGDDSASPDTEILNAIKPGMGTIPGAMLLCASSPYARRGVLWEAYRRFFGHDSAPALVWKALTRTMNPSFPQRIIDEACEADPSAAGAEYMAEFRTDIEAFVNREVVDCCTSVGVKERLPIRGVKYVGFVDPSGGSNDSMTLAIAHREDDLAVLDMVREVRPPFSPEVVVKDFAADLKRYGLLAVVGDRYGGEFVREPFRRHGVVYDLADRPRSDLYRDTLPLLNSGRADLLDLPRLTAQLVGLERRTGRTGRDAIDHGPTGHDDVANAVAGALVAAVAIRKHALSPRPPRFPEVADDPDLHRRRVDPVGRTQRDGSRPTTHQRHPRWRHRDQGPLDGLPSKIRAGEQHRIQPPGRSGTLEADFRR